MVSSSFRFKGLELIHNAVSFPHYFLQATGHLAEQLKTREWIVARITSITERIVDQHVCDIHYLVCHGSFRHYIKGFY